MDSRRRWRTNRLRNIATLLVLLRGQTAKQFHPIIIVFIEIMGFLYSIEKTTGSRAMLSTVQQATRDLP